MNDHDPINEPDAQTEPIEDLGPQPMKAKPILQTMSWMAGVAAGGFLAFLFVVKPSHSRGATKACHAAWQLRNSKPAQVADQRQLASEKSNESRQSSEAIDSDALSRANQKEDDHERRIVRHSGH
ncbi:MAG: hypothetical protein DHS20C16_09350 [Phycisphaerae bacterium]|nr:MAG: hypothetical protein DHS20C16_09350 [Phycisphaerae bacterium]